MKNFITLNDLPDFQKAVDLAKLLKENPYSYKGLGKQKTLGLLFFNPSLRTRLSTKREVYRSFKQAGCKAYSHAIPD